MTDQKLPLQVIDKGKFANFDGFILEVSGLSGSASSKRIALNVFEKIALAKAGDETMLMVKSKKGGFGLVVSEEKKAEWENFVSQVQFAKENFKE